MIKQWIDFAFVAQDLNARALIAGHAGLTDESLAELADQLMTDQAETILDDYESRLGVDASWARDRLCTLSQY